MLKCINIFYSINKYSAMILCATHRKLSSTVCSYIQCAFPAAACYQCTFPIIFMTHNWILSTIMIFCWLRSHIDKEIIGFVSVKIIWSIFLHSDSYLGSQQLSLLNLDSNISANHYEQTKLVPFVPELTKLVPEQTIILPLYRRIIPYTIT